MGVLGFRRSISYKDSSWSRVALTLRWWIKDKRKMNRSCPPRPNSNPGGDRSNVGLFATLILLLFSQENPVKGITYSLMDVLLDDENAWTGGWGERNLDSDDFPYSSPKILDCERIRRGINKERKKELFILFPKEERGQMHRVVLVLKGEGFSFLLSFKGQGEGKRGWIHVYFGPQLYPGWLRLYRMWFFWE